MKMCGHTLRYHVRNDNSATEVVWPRKEARPRLHRKKYSGDVVVHLGEEKEEDRSRDGWSVSTETCEPSEYKR